MKAWIENNRVRDVAQGSPADIYHKDIAALYDTEVPDGTVNGATLVDGVWANPPPPPEPLPYVAPPVPASEVITAIKAERDRRKFNGVKVGTQWLHTDTYSRTQWLGMVLMGAGIPAIEWTTMDGSTITTSQALAGQVFQGTAQLDATLFGYARSLIAQVEAAADPASVDIVNGWPATFGEV